jgi:hypothetical protein
MEVDFMLTEIIMALATGAIMSMDGRVQEAYDRFEWANDKIEVCTNDYEEYVNMHFARKEVEKFFKVIKMDDDNNYIIITQNGKGMCGDALEASEFISENSEYTAVVYEDQILMSARGNKCIYVDLDEDESYILMAGNVKFS